ncbi:MAG: UDP-N-acetylmuramate dehydrogenase [Candidatus Neomarinimicrobiota bacterium]
MLRVTENVDLSGLSTFRVPARGRRLAVIDTSADLEELLARPDFTAGNLLTLGHGSNILFAGDFDGWLLKIAAADIRIAEQNEQYIWLDVGAGEDWPALVEYTVAAGWSGIENLALIPGTVGAAPVQNIGAYGVELSDVFHSLTAFNLTDGRVSEYTAAAGGFGYRDSFFKANPQLVILQVMLRLEKQFMPRLEYGDLAGHLERSGIAQPTAAAVLAAVSEIRRGKLPDPLQLGNGGSFFKNPVIPAAAAENLRSRYPDVPLYVTGTEEFKISAAWLIERCGWKGKRRGNCGVYEKHALVLVNYGGASGPELVRLADDIVDSVRQKFAVTLHPEVKIIR